MAIVSLGFCTVAALKPIVVRQAAYDFDFNVTTICKVLIHIIFSLFAPFVPSLSFRLVVSAHRLVINEAPHNDVNKTKL